jgi:hypothetical protein
MIVLLNHYAFILIKKRNKKIPLIAQRDLI